MKKGSTLIELMVALIIIFIMTGITASRIIRTQSECGPVKIAEEDQSLKDLYFYLPDDETEYKVWDAPCDKVRQMVFNAHRQLKALAEAGKLQPKEVDYGAPIITPSENE